MKRFLLALLLLASPAAFATAPSPLYCIAASQTACSSTTEVGNGREGDIWWKAFGKVNDIGNQLGIFSTQAANKVLGTGPSGGLPALETLAAAGITSFTGAITATHCAEWSASGVLEDSGGACGGGGTPGGTSGQLQYNNAGAFGGFTLAGDCTLSQPNITCTKTNGTAFSALATTVPGTGVATALAVNVGSAGAFVVNGGALGTPSSGTLTNATGLPLSTGITGFGTGVEAFLATPTSANLAGALTDETGSGPAVFATSPTLTTPNLGTPSAITLTNGTGLPIAGLSGLGTGMSGFLALAWPTLVNGDCLTNNGTALSWGACGGSGTLPSCSSSQGVYYATTGTTVSCLTFGSGLSLVGSTLTAPDSTINGVAVPANADALGTDASATPFAVSPTGCLSYSNRQWYNVAPVYTETGAFTIGTNSDDCALEQDTSATGVTVSVPPASGSFAANYTVSVQQLGAGVLTFTPLAVSSPTIGTASAGTGGSLSAATYFCAVSAKDAAGETLVSSSSSAAVSASGTLVCPWTDVSYATSYDVWISTATITNGEATVAYVNVASTANTYTFSSVPGTTATTPASNTTASTINGLTSIATTAQYQYVKLWSDGTNWKATGTYIGGGGSSSGSSYSWYGAGASAAGTDYTVPGGFGTSQNFAGLVPVNSSTVTITYWQANAATGSATVITLYFGTPTAFSASATATCTVAVTSHTCSVTSASQSLTAGQGWTIQINNAGTVGTGAEMLGVQMN